MSLYACGVCACLGVCMCVDYGDTIVSFITKHRDKVRACLYVCGMCACLSVCMCVDYSDTIVSFITKHMGKVCVCLYIGDCMRARCVRISVSVCV